MRPKRPYAGSQLSVRDGFDPAIAAYEHLITSIRKPRRSTIFLVPKAFDRHLQGLRCHERWIPAIFAEGNRRAAICGRWEQGEVGPATFVFKESAHEFRRTVISNGELTNSA